MALELRQAPDAAVGKASGAARTRYRLLAYHGSFILACAGLLALMGLSSQSLPRPGDTTQPSQAAALQQAEDPLFGSALYYRPVPYKLALYKLRKPGVAIVGSSRPMQFVG